MSEEKDTPLFIQYKTLKDEHPDEVLFFRVGDFYEMFDSDADEVSKLLNLTLTHRGDRHMCGIPYHASKIYIARLLRLGKKIAIAEQVGEIAKPGQGLTLRKVTEIITPGTAVESEYLEGGVNNFLASLFISGKEAGFACIDVTTGEFKATSFSLLSLAENFPKELSRCRARELLLPNSLRENKIVNEVVSVQQNLSVSFYPDWNFNAELSYKRLLRQFNTTTLRSFSLTESSAEVPPAAFLLDYLEKTTNTASPHVRSINVYKDSDYVIIDDSSARNLEIIGNLRDGEKEFSLLECVDFTHTSMGSRMIRKWLMFPLTDVKRIISRQNHVELFVNNRPLLKKFGLQLDGILDIERLAGRIAMDKAHAKDLQALKTSLVLWISAQESLGSFNFASMDTKPAKEIIELISKSILDDPSTILTEGRIIKEGWNGELDHWRSVQTDFNRILEEYLEQERLATGIQNLRIKKTNNAGYCIEVTKGKLSKVPEHFIIRRALVNADRYTTAKLQELEENLNESGIRVLELERDLFLEVRSSLKKYVPYLQQMSSEIAYADVCSSFAKAACAHNWVRPAVDESLVFDVKGGRHPVVELHIPKGEFVQNDLRMALEEDSRRFALITGPNMAGKSTFLRQNALIALLAQTGSFVPCSEARLGVVDKIFCRVGASDNLARGESTFLVEMTETARILRSATEHSLVIMDEVGRGTSTEDGLSIAWAVSEYLLGRIKCKTLFATHYHELTRMEHQSLKKLCMAVDENGESIVFLRKVCAGSAHNSYGIHVASLAGVPEPVIERAKSILEHIQSEAKDKPIIQAEPIEENACSHAEKKVEERQENSCDENFSFTGALFSDEELILDEILSLDIDNLTPIAALQSLARWKKTLSGR